MRSRTRMSCLHIFYKNDNEYEYEMDSFSYSYSLSMLTLSNVYLRNTPSLLHTSFVLCMLFNSNKLGRATPQSKVESKMASYRTAVMIFTAILDLEARRKAKEASKAGRRKICRMRQFSRALHRPFLGLFCPIRVSYCACCTASSLHKAIKSLVSSNHYASAILLNHAL